MKQALVTSVRVPVRRGTKKHQNKDAQRGLLTRSRAGPHRGVNFTTAVVALIVPQAGLYGGRLGGSAISICFLLFDEFEARKARRSAGWPPQALFGWWCVMSAARPAPEDAGSSAGQREMVGSRVGPTGAPCPVYFVASKTPKTLISNGTETWCQQRPGMVRLCPSRMQVSYCECPCRMHGASSGPDGKEKTW